MLKTGLMVSTTASQADTSQMTTVTGFSAVTTEPVGTAIKYVIKVGDGKWQKYDTSTKAWADVATQSLTSSSVLSEGNTAAELNAVPEAAMSKFAGTVVNNAMAISMDDTATDVPSWNPLEIIGKTGSEVHEEIVTSDSVNLSSNDEAVEILDAKVTKTELSGGTIVVNASIKDASNNWSEWKELSAYITTPCTKAKAIKLQYVASAPTIGASQAELAKVEIKHRTDNIAVFSEGTGYCMTKTLTLTRTMTRAHLMIKHPVVLDSKVNAYISLRPKPVSVTQEVLGVGDGTQHTYTLAHPTKVAEHTFKLYYDGEAQATGYSFSSADGKVTCVVPTGKSATADYSYNWEKETFTPMTYDQQYNDTLNENLVNDQFNYVKTKDTDPEGAVTSIKMELVQGKGNVTDEDLGTGIGSLQSFVLPHKAKPETLVIKQAGTVMTDVTYKEATRTVFVTAPEGVKVTASYEWLADPNYIDNFYVVYNE